MHQIGVMGQRADAGGRQPARLCRQEQRHQRHAEVHPAALAHRAVDGHDDPHRRVEEGVVARELRPPSRHVAPVDAECGVKPVTGGALAVLQMRRHGIGKVVVFADRRARVGDALRQRVLQRGKGCARQRDEVARLQVRPARRTPCVGQDRRDIGRRNGGRQIGADRPAPRQKLREPRVGHARDSTLSGRARARAAVMRPASTALIRSPGMKAVTSHAASPSDLPRARARPVMPKA